MITVFRVYDIAVNDPHIITEKKQMDEKRPNFSEAG